MREFLQRLLLCFLPSQKVAPKCQTSCEAVAGKIFWYASLHCWIFSLRGYFPSYWISILIIIIQLSSCKKGAMETLNASVLLVNNFQFKGTKVTSTDFKPPIFQTCFSYTFLDLSILKKCVKSHLQVVEEESRVGQVEDHLLHPQTKRHGL